METSLGPEMKSTGEVMGVDRHFPHALYKAMLAAGLRVSFSGAVLFSVADRDKEEAVAAAKEYAALGYNLRATPGTAEALREAGLSVQAAGEVIPLLRSGAVGLVVNTPTRGKAPGRPGFLLRRTAAEYKVPCLTSLDTARALAMVLRSLQQGEKPRPVSISELGHRYEKVV